MKVREVFETMEYCTVLEGKNEVLTWLKSHDNRFGHFINGNFKEAKSIKNFDVENPSDRSILAKCTLGSKETVDAAVQAAKAAQPSWAKMKGTDRARYVYAIARHLQKHQRKLAVLESLNNGKTIRESRDIDLPLAIRHFYYHAGWAANQNAELADFEAIGVCGQIIPWNFPLLMLAWKIAPAIAMGNTVVLKPAEQTPLTALAFAEICQGVGLPPGVVNIVTGDATTGAAIVSHKDVKKIAFTGSVETGRLIRKYTAGSGKRLTLELGGKSPFIVFDDADLDSAVEGVVDSIWLNQGQVCCAGSRLLIQEGIAEKFITKLRKRLENLRVGDPLDKCVDMGPVISIEQLNKITGFIERAIINGAEIYSAALPNNLYGHYFPPTLVCNVEPASEIVQEEIFGPVLVSMTFRTPDEAVQIANHTRFGLAGCVWSENINLALDVADRVEAGVIWVNSANQLDAAAEFGGTKESGFGREGGRDGLFAYLQQKEAKLPSTKKTKFSSASKRTDILDRTQKLYIDGKQVRQDGGHSYEVVGHDGSIHGYAGVGNRKDIRNAVEVASVKTTWTDMPGHGRAQVLYYLAENLAVRKAEFSERVSVLTGYDGSQEVEASIDLLFQYAGWADKFDGAIRNVNAPGIVLKMNNSIGVIGQISPEERPLIGFIEMVAPALAMGNRVVVLPSSKYPLLATDFYQLVETSDVPAGALNIITGYKQDLIETLARHNAVGSIWVADQEDVNSIELGSIGNLKRTFLLKYGLKIPEILRQATVSKSVWIPFGK